MLFKHMDKGFLDNIITLSKQDRSLYRFIPDVPGDENMRVRLGATALVKELSNEHKTELRNSVPELLSFWGTRTPPSVEIPFMCSGRSRAHRHGNL